MRKRLTPAVIRLAFIAAVLGAFFALTSPALAAPPILISASHVDRHPAATWTLPPGVKAQVAEVATSPATSTDGAFFFENVEAYSVLEDAQTNWVYNFQLDPGTYYLHISGLDEPCYYAALCPVREYSQIATLVIPAATPPPPPPPPLPPPPPPPPTPAPSALVRCVVPKVVGQSLAAAKAKIRKAHCSVGKVSRKRSSKRLRNRVVGTSPRPKTQLRSGARVSLVVGLGPRR